MAQMLSTLSIVAFVVAGIGLLLAIFFWFFFKIPAVIGDLSGRTARKSIEKMRAANESAGAGPHRQAKSQPGKAVKPQAQSRDRGPQTGLLAENRAEQTQYDGTGVLKAETTGILETEQTGLLFDEQATAPLKDPASPQKRVPDVQKLVMCDEVMLVHTDEVIE